MCLDPSSLVRSSEILDSKLQEQVGSMDIDKMCLDPSSLVRSSEILDSKLQEQVGSMDIDKMCLDPSSLVRSSEILDSRLQEQVGSMDIVNPLRAMFAEHCRAPDSNTEYTPLSYPGLSCTPQGEFFFVVGEHGIDQKEWKLNGGARPTCRPGSMVEGRNNTSLDELMTAPEVKDAKLIPEEVLAIRLCSGPQRHVYNAILGQLSTSEIVTNRNSYPTTIAVIVSAIKKLSTVAKTPEGSAVWRSLASGVGLPDVFVEPDEQGFRWGLDPGFMATSRDKLRPRGRGQTVFKILLSKMSMGADIAWYASPPRQFTGFSLSQHESYFMLLREPSGNKCAGCHSFNMSLRCSSHPAPSCK